jgi:ABC-2 type transport system ATP-binding protein
MELTPAVEITDLAKTFSGGVAPRRRKVALGGITLSIPRGMIFGVLGPNGAGKTTLLSILATLLLPDRGRVRALGLDVVRDAARLRERINMVSGNANFLWSLTPREILDFYSRCYGMDRAARVRKVGTLIELFELGAHAGVPYMELSTGLKQRLALAKALVNDPELLLLDEPTTGLDPDIAIRIRQAIAGFPRERGVTILLTTHDMREAEQLSDELIFLREGQIQARGSAGAIKRQLRLGDMVSFAVDGTWSEIPSLPGLLKLQVTDGHVRCLVDDARQRLPELLRALEARGVTVRDLRVREPDLEAVFVELAKPQSEMA